MIKVPDSERLTYRFLTENDADLLFELDQDVDVMKYINGGTMTTMKDIHEIFLPRMAAYSDQGKGWGLWGVFTQEDQSFIGWILVRPMDFFSKEPKWSDIELGWRFKQNAWGKGFGTESATAVRDRLAATAQMTHFSAISYPDNSGSISIMTKLGMKYIKTGIHKDPLGDEEVVYYQQTVK